VRKTLEGIHDQGVNVTPAQRVLEMARDASMDGDFDKAERLTRESEEMGRRLMAERDEYTLQRKRAEVRLAESGTDDAHLHELMSAADAQSSGGEYRRALGTLEQAVQAAIPDQAVHPATTAEEGLSEEPRAKVTKVKVPSKKAGKARTGAPAPHAPPSPPPATQPDAAATEEAELVAEEEPGDDPAEALAPTPDQMVSQPPDPFPTEPPVARAPAVQAPIAQPPAIPHPFTHQAHACPGCGAPLVVRTSIRPTIVRCASCGATVTLR
jgi:hypothetical protein